MADLDGKPAEQFLEALKRRNLEGKKALIADLRRRKTDKAIDILLDVLQDDSWYLRELAVDALGEAGTAAVPRLTELLDSGLWYTRAAAARTLGKIGHVPTVPMLVKLLGDPNQTVQGASLASLADFVRKGRALDVARGFWAEGPRRSEELKRLLLAVHAESGEQVAAILAEPASLTPGTPESRNVSESGNGETAEA